MCYNVANLGADIPKPRTRAQIEELVRLAFRGRGLNLNKEHLKLNENQIERIIQMLCDYEENFFDVEVGEEMRTFCRECGGRVSEDIAGKYHCMNCNKALPTISIKPFI